MEGYFILLFATFEICFSEWVLLSTFSPKQNKIESRLSQEHEYDISLKNISREKPEFCPDFHNLTTMSYGTLFKEEIRSRTGWEISLEDVEELLKEKEKLPKATNEKANLLKHIGENFMLEAEKQTKALFSPSREARTKYFNSHSMESTLLTISMLLFGVYLTKLILNTEGNTKLKFQFQKLLLSHYNRYNGGVAMMTGIRAPITLTQGRRKRSATKLQKIILMHLIDKYNSRFN